jgi:hypothetical protein
MKTIRLLTIGNSFSENALTYLEAMANSTSSVRFHVGRASLGGCSLEKHWNLAEYTARVPEHKTYRIRPGADGATIEGSLQVALSLEPWDYVTLQQVSTKSWRPETFQPHLGKLHGLVREHAPQAKVMLHQTWAYRSDSSFLPQNGLTQELMFERIRSTYARYAAELGCGVLPSGEAVQRARRASGRTFAWPDAAFSYLDPTSAPALPRQDHSLAVGWHWAINDSPEGIPELRNDPNHLNAPGCYLIGCVWFERLTGLDARSVSFHPAEVDADTATFLRATAHETCSGYAKKKGK